MAGFERLSERTQSRLVIENDDRSYGLGHVLALHERTGLRVVWDILHHHCNDPDGIPDREALGQALATWPDGVRPKIHYSSPKTAIEQRKRRVGRRVERTLALPQLRAHADLIDPIGFECACASSWPRTQSSAKTVRSRPARFDSYSAASARPTRS